MTSTSLSVPPSPGDVESVPRRLASSTPPILHYALRASALQRDWAARATGKASATAQVFALGIDAESLDEFVQMQLAVWQRLLALQSSWAQDWRLWIQYCDQIKGANTLSKLAEREGNIVAQLTQILSNQVTDLIGLQENIDVGYSYWIHEKLEQKRKSLSNSVAPT